MDTWGVLFLTMALFGVAGIIGIVYLILFVTMGTIGNNRYGPDPLEKQHLELIQRLYAMQNMIYPAYPQSQIPGTTNTASPGPAQVRGPSVAEANPGASLEAPYGKAQATYRNRCMTPEQETAIQKVCGDTLFENTLSSPYRNPSPMGSYQESLEQAKKAAQNTAELTPKTILYTDNDSTTTNLPQDSNTISQTDYGSFTYTATNEQANTYTPPSGITVDGSFYPASAPVASNQASSLNSNSTPSADFPAAYSTAAESKSIATATSADSSQSAPAMKNLSLSAPDESELSLDKTHTSAQVSSKETQS